MNMKRQIASVSTLVLAATALVTTGVLAHSSDNRTAGTPQAVAAPTSVAPARRVPAPSLAPTPTSSTVSASQTSHPKPTRSVHKPEPVRTTTKATPSTPTPKARPKGALTPRQACEEGIRNTDTFGYSIQCVQRMSSAGSDLPGEVDVVGLTDDGSRSIRIAYTGNGSSPLAYRQAAFYEAGHALDNTTMTNTARKWLLAQSGGDSWTSNGASTRWYDLGMERFAATRSVCDGPGLGPMTGRPWSCSTFNTGMAIARGDRSDPAARRVLDQSSGAADAKLARAHAQVAPQRAAISRWIKTHPGCSANPDGLEVASCGPAFTTAMESSPTIPEPLADEVWDGRIK